MKSLNLVPDLNTMNSMIYLITITAGLDTEKKLSLMMKRLTEMRDSGIRPNLHTFNTCLNLIKSFGMNQRTPVICLDILKEMEILGIEPSLATYAHVLGIFYPSRDNGRTTQVLEQIIERVEEQKDKLEWRDKNDSLFFRVAMEKCYQASSTTDNAKRLHAVLNSNNNIKFLSDNFNMNKY
jgi:pentatricopeptide repeat domain-containing protein 3